MKPERSDAVTLGYASIDHFLCVEKYPSQGQKIPFYGRAVMGGGQAATAAAALARWGVRTRYIGRVGDDGTGDSSIAWLNNEGVLTDSVIRTPGVSSQTAYIIVPAETGERTVIWNREPGLNLRASDLDKDWFTGTKILFVDGHELDAAATAARWIRESGGIVVLDAEHIGADRNRLLRLTDIAVGSEDFGMREFGIRSPEETIAAVRNAGVGFAGITLGKDGCLIDWGEGLRRFRSIRVPVVDTTGAGDIFHAGLVYGAWKTMKPADMVAFATVAAGLSCRALGGRSAIPSTEEVMRRMAAEGSLEVPHV